MPPTFLPQVFVTPFPLPKVPSPLCPSNLWEQSPSLFKAFKHFQTPRQPPFAEKSALVALRRVHVSPHAPRRPTHAPRRPTHARSQARTPPAPYPTSSRPIWLPCPRRPRFLLIVTSPGSYLIRVPRRRINMCWSLAKSSSAEPFFSRNLFYFPKKYPGSFMLFFRPIYDSCLFEIF